MSRLQLIENSLIAINETVFQELCDSFLIIRNNNYKAFSRIGSQSGKQKTIKGTPDTFLLLPNGKYIFVEYSTNITSGLVKLKEDIKKCIDKNKTGIDPNLIAEIIICINFNLKPVEIEELKEVLADTRVTLTIYTLDALSLELHLHHRDLANQYLGIHLDTGQIISIEQFISEYNKASRGIATPLDNTFVHREKELENLIDVLISEDFIILTGAPGVGKTKLSIEAINVFIKKNPSFNAYCVSYKSHSLLEDLYQYFNNDKDYILFVDDANRIDAFSQITGFYKAIRKGKLKLIITVRDYAYQEISYLCSDFSPRRIDLAKFSDDQITDIIKSEPFEILNPEYQKPIIRIADGNPRIAIMTAMLAKEKQNINVLYDLTELFEKYFLTFVKDDGEFANPLNVKCLGIISFFYTVPFKNKEITTSILKNFEIDYNDFIDSVDRLEKLELVEIQYEYVKIPEQNLSTYFFYKAFIKDKLLDFYMLLEKYFTENNYRFRDSVIPANNTFGPERVMDTLMPDLKKYYENIKSDYDKAYKFLTTFWFYLQNETLTFLLRKIQETDNSTSSEYIVTYERNAFSYNKNQIIELIKEFFTRNNEHLKTALELSFDFVRRNPEQMPELVHNLTETLKYDREDEQFGFYRQKTFVDVACDGLKKDDVVSAKIFFEVSKMLLKYKFNHFKGGRGNSFYVYDYVVPNNKYIKQIRKQIWDYTLLKFDFFSTEAMELLQSYVAVQPDVTKEIMREDISSVVKIIEEKLNPEQFPHCQFVHNLIHWTKRNSVKNPLFELLSKKFTNATYNFFIKIDWDRFKNREMYEFDDYKEYERLKEEEIRSSFQLKSKDEIVDFYEKFKYLKSISKNDWSYNRSLEIVLDENAKNSEISFDILNFIIERNNEINYYPRAFFFNHLKKKENAAVIYDIISSSQFKGKAAWLLAFFDYLDESLVTEKYVEDLINTIENYKDLNFVQFDNLTKYLVLRPTLLSDVLAIIVKRNATEDLKIQLWLDTFESHFKDLGEDLSILKIAYIQQDNIQRGFDYDGRSFIKILEKEPSFLLEYVKANYDKHELKISGEARNLSKIWEIDGIQNSIREVFDFVIENTWYFGGDHFCNIFFKEIKSENMLTASNFLKEFCKSNFNNPKAMEVLVDITRHTMQNMYEPIILLYLKLNQDVEAFRKIHWRGTFTSASGDVILSDIEAADWRNILAIIEKSELGIEILEIKSYVNQMIEWCIERGNEERQRRFLSRY